MEAVACDDRRMFHGSSENYVMVSKHLRKPFWLATKLYPQHNQLGGNFAWTLTYTHRTHWAQMYRHHVAITTTHSPPWSDCCSAPKWLSGIPPSLHRWQMHILYSRMHTHTRAHAHTHSQDITSLSKSEKREREIEIDGERERERGERENPTRAPTL